MLRVRWQTPALLVACLASVLAVADAETVLVSIQTQTQEDMDSLTAQVGAQAVGSGPARVTLGAIEATMSREEQEQARRGAEAARPGRKWTGLMKRRRACVVDLSLGVFFHQPPTGRMGGLCHHR